MGKAQNFPGYFGHEKATRKKNKWKEEEGERSKENECLNGEGERVSTLIRREHSESQWREEPCSDHDVWRATKRFHMETVILVRDICLSWSLELPAFVIKGQMNVVYAFGFLILKSHRHSLELSFKFLN